MKKDLVRSVIATVSLLLIPLIAMQFTQEVNWDRGDFVIMGALIFGASLIFNLVMQKLRHNRNRVLVGALIIAVFLYIWAELAVGIFTNLGR